MNTDSAPPCTPEQWRAAIVDPDHGVRERRDLGRLEFEQFVLTTWEALVLWEGKANGAKPSICTFCRMDIGIRIEEGHSPSYFVNGVQRTQKMSLWLNSIVNAGTLMNTFAMVFQQWLKDSLNPYIL